MSSSFMKRDIVFRTKNKKATKEVIPQMSQSEMKAVIERGREENAERKARIAEKVNKKSAMQKNPQNGFVAQSQVILSDKRTDLTKEEMNSVVRRELKRCSR